MNHSYIYMLLRKRSVANLKILYNLYNSFAMLKVIFWTVVMV